MLRQTHNARRFDDPIILAKSTVTIDDFGHRSVGEPVEVMKVYARVRQMSATKTMMTFEQADIVGYEVEFRTVGADFNCIVWKGRTMYFSQPESVDDRGWYTRLNAWHHVDNPKV